MGWEALEQWGDDVTRVEPLTGGVANQVWSVRLKGQLAVARLGARSAADLAWETDLLRYLDGEGLAVPVPFATLDGRLFADGLVVMSYVAGSIAGDGGGLAAGGPDAAPPARADAGLAAAPGLALVDRPAGRRDRNEGRPGCDAA